MKVLITGCAGFIGSSTAEVFLKNGHSVIGIDNFDSILYPRNFKERNIKDIISMPAFQFIEGDIADKKLFKALPADVDCIIHLAAKAGVRPSIQHPMEYAETNITGTMNILEWMKENRHKKMVFASSSSIYGNNSKIPFCEDDMTDKPISPYAATKKACELINHTYHHLYHLDIINLRFFTVYGPRQRPDLAIRKFVDLISRDNPVILFGDGGTARDYTYIDDITKGIYSAFGYVMSKTSVFETINIGNNTPVKLIDLVNSISRILNKIPNIKYEPMQPGDVNVTYANIDKAQKLLNFSPSTGMNEGLKKYVQWRNLN